MALANGNANGRKTDSARLSHYSAVRILGKEAVLTISKTKKKKATKHVIRKAQDKILQDKLAAS